VQNYKTHIAYKLALLDGFKLAASLCVYTVTKNHRLYDL